MKWEDREDVVVRKEAIEVLMDGIHQNIDEDELSEFAEAHNVPYSRQKPKSATPSAPDAYVDSHGNPVSQPTQSPFISSDDDDDDDDDYDESDYYVSS